MLPTILHIVRILQASRRNIKKYKTLTPKVYCKGYVKHLDPFFFLLSKYGYALSCLEQLGNIYRYNKMYCRKSNFEPIKCKKIDKYMKRYNNGIFYFNKFNTGFNNRLSIIDGGNNGNNDNNRNKGNKALFKIDKNKKKTKNYYKPNTVIT